MIWVVRFVWMGGGEERNGFVLDELDSFTPHSNTCEQHLSALDTPNQHTTNWT